MLAQGEQLKAQDRSGGFIRTTGCIARDLTSSEADRREGSGFQTPDTSRHLLKFTLPDWLQVDLLNQHPLDLRLNKLLHFGQGLQANSGIPAPSCINLIQFLTHFRSTGLRKPILQVEGQTTLKLWIL
jgi:hypothetical protein